MSINLAEEKQKIIHDLRNSHADILKENSLQESITNQIDDWGLRCNIELRRQNPFIGHLGSFLEWRRNHSHYVEFVSNECLSDYQEFCSIAGVPSNILHWKRSLSPRTNSTEKHSSQNHDDPDMRTAAVQVFFETWQKQLDKVVAQWEMEALARLRNEFIKGLLEKLDLVRNLKSHIEKLGMDFGFWFDDSLGKLDKHSIDNMKRWLNYLSSDESIRKIIEILGKMKHVDESSVMKEVCRSVHVKSPFVETCSRQEIVGVYLGKNIEHTVPSELALLSSSDTSIMFDLKYIESKLMCFEMQGISWADTETSITEEVEFHKTNSKGPMILCVDTSGSMSGTPEAIAKAVTLFIASKAREKNRSCYIINFSTGIHTFEFTRSGGISDLLQFLQNSFHGGTDVSPALLHAIAQAQQNDYKNADTLVISDFVMGSLNKDTLDLINSSRQKGNRFYSLVIGDLFMTNRLETHFDNEWIYNPYHQRIDDLTGVGRKLFNPSPIDS